MASSARPHLLAKLTVAGLNTLAKAVMVYRGINNMLTLKQIIKKVKAEGDRGAQRKRQLPAKALGPGKAASGGPRAPATLALLLKTLVNSVMTNSSKRLSKTLLPS